MLSNTRQIFFPISNAFFLAMAHNTHQISNLKAIDHAHSHLRNQCLGLGVTDDIIWQTALNDFIFILTENDSLF